MADFKKSLEIIVGDSRFQKLKSELFKESVELLKLTGNKGNFFEIYLVNSRFMKKNVLAFPYPSDFPSPDITGKFLGEVYLNPDYIKKHKEDLRFMLIHGFLHLLGYDHIKRNDRIVMDKKEKQLFGKLSGENQ